MEDEAADIALLEQHLNKSTQLSTRMTSILHKFDSRLVKLEKSILPLHKSTQSLTRVVDNIDKTLHSIQMLANDRDNVVVEEALILKGCFAQARLAESGAKKLAQLFTKKIAEASSSVVPLVTSLRALPVPSSHPSHPAARDIFKMLEEAQQGYADMRGGWAKRCLEPGTRRIMAAAEKDTGTVDGGRDFGLWVEGMLALAEAEYSVLLELVPLQTPQAIASTYATLTTPLINLLDAGTTRCDNDPVGNRTNWLRAYTSMRAICLRSFPELIADIKTAGQLQVGTSGKPVEIGFGIAPITASTVGFLTKLPAVQDAVIASLKVLGDGNWNMGAASGNMRRIGDPSNEADERAILESFTHDVISHLLTTITTLTKTQKQLALSSIFLINNVSHLRLHLILAPSTPATYLESNFTALVSCLSEDKAQSGLGSNKQGVKEKALRFFDSLEDIIERHRFATVLAEDDEGRERLADDVVKLVVPVFSSFLAKHREKEFSRNIKASPEEVERQLRSCY
ncbi:hypothetical protein BS47DRAFT_1371949 [Hydnum rufescens UP504]|uniref:Exocyst complex protein EXO70 n=1 Tax=Hydnum rufescens UP504 TaxID=1448309 RepID=A0A9P6B1M2_9AGAM|nr:hypothetical protein BS47DRAFT_1371949 [Hydnum rufescens UP504]